MSVDKEQGSVNELSIDKLRQLVKELAIENSRQATQIRFLESKNRELEKWAAGFGFNDTVISKLREKVLLERVSSLSELKPKRGRPSSFYNKVQIEKLWDDFENRHDKNQKLKTWLREKITADYKEYPTLSITKRKAKIEAKVKRFEVAMNRQKKKKLAREQN